MTIKEPSLTVWIAASPGPLRDALLALLLSLPQVSSVQTSGFPEEILKAAPASLMRLIIIVMETGHMWADLPEKIKEACQDCRVIVLANGEIEFRSADLVLQQGARPDILVSAFLSMLSN
jgi:hypothetical protein